MPGSDEVKAASPRVRLTYDDFLLFPDDGKRHELIDGEHYVTPSPNLRHQEIAGRLYLALGNWLATHPVGRVFFAPLDIAFTRFDVVEPDLLFVSKSRDAGWLNEKNATGADLVIEIGSPATRRRDQTIKRDLYERTEVQEYWFVDPDQNRIHVHRKTDGRFGDAVEFTSERD